MVDFVFILTGLVCLASAILIVSRPNPVYSVIWMLPFFIGMSVLFVMLSAPFLATMLMMVYGGAILITFLFVIMLFNLRPEEMKDDGGWKTALPAVILCGALGGVIVGFGTGGVDSAMEVAFAKPALTQAQKEALPAKDVKAPAPATPEAGATDAVKADAVKATAAPEVSDKDAFGGIKSLSLPLFRKFLIPFELVSVLLTVAVLGAVVLSKKKI